MIKFSKYLLICISAISLSCNGSGQKNNRALNSENILDKPNIIYILADDLGYGDLSVTGQEKYETPNIDKLASQGMFFTQHYSGSTVCAPSRSSLLTGMHTGHTFIRGNKEIQPEGQYPIPDETYTLAEAMQKNGYVTGAFGKWGLGFPNSEGDPVNQGFDVFYGYNCQRMGHNYYPDHLWSNKDSIVLDNNLKAQKGTYAPDLIHGKTLEFIEDNKDRPFFLYVASIIPHAELAAPEEVLKNHRGKYPPEKKYKGVDGPEYGQGEYASQNETHAAFAAMIDVLDMQVGEIMKKVEELGIAENTIIIFTSDNGPHTEGGADPDYFNSNGSFRGTKRDLYEGGIRVPMIAKWPNKIEPGSKTTHLSAFWDIFPTFMEIVGGENPDDLDGISFLPTLYGKEEKQIQHDYLYWEFHEKGGRQAVRKGNWKAVKNNVLKAPNAPMELYNLSKDIGEKNNLANQHPEVIKEMKAIFKDARTPSNIFSFGQETYLNVQ
jgi:arylsulfatase A-like enzyme